jgi:hypothetical protein
MKRRGYERKRPWLILRWCSAVCLERLESQEITQSRKATVRPEFVSETSRIRGECDINSSATQKARHRQKEMKTFKQNKTINIRKKQRRNKTRLPGLDESAPSKHFCLMYDKNRYSFSNAYESYFSVMAICSCNKKQKSNYSRIRSCI